MRKLIVMSLALVISSFSFAQKKELKEAEKAIKDNDYAGAMAAIGAADNMVSSMDDKLKAKYYFLKAQALYANGTADDASIDKALESFKMLKETEEKSGKMVYSAKADEMKVAMTNSFIERAQTALNRKDHKTSASYFEKAYKASPADTLYLYNAALLATSTKQYDKALAMYDDLMKMGYTGISTEYFATDIETGEEQSFPAKNMRDLSVNVAKTHEKPRDVTSESKIGEMAKNIALIYIEQGDSDKALQAIEEAKKTSPNDFNLILSEANVRYKLGQVAEYKTLVAKALEIEPNNVDLLFNLGVVASDLGNNDEAMEYYKKAIAMDETYTRAYMNAAALILGQEQGIIDEMNQLGTSAADDKKYEELQETRMNLYRDAVPYLKSALDLEPENINAAKTLMNIYSVLGDTPNFKAMQAKVAEIEGGN